MCKRLLIGVFVIILISCTQETKQQTTQRLKFEINQSIQNEDTVRAIELFDQYIKLNPNDKDAQTLLIALKIRTGKIEEAEGLKKIKELNKGVGTQSGDQLETLMILQNESAEKAVEQLDMIITRYPDYYYNYYMKGQKLIELKKFEEAIKIFDQVIQMEPDFRYAYAEKALAQYMLGDKEGACNAWKTSQGGGSTYREKYCK